MFTFDFDGRSRFPKKSRRSFRMFCVFRLEKLQRHPFVQGDMPSFHDVPHAALTKHSLDAVFIGQQRALRDSR